MRRPKVFPRAAVGLAVLTVLAWAAGGQAQHTPDPYNIVGEYNLGYEDAMYPSYPNGAGFSSNQGILQSRSGMSRSNQFQSYLDGVDGLGGTDTLFGAGRARSGAGVPYYRAHREFDEAFNRVYTPNAISDQTFRADQEARTKLYIEYLKEADPKKRAELYRAYTLQSRRTARDLGLSSRAALRQGSTASPSSAPAIAPSPSPSSLVVPAPGAARDPRATPRANPYRVQSRMPGATRPRTGPSRVGETPEETLERAVNSATRPSAAPAPARAPARPGASLVPPG